MKGLFSSGDKPSPNSTQNLYFQALNHKLEITYLTEITQQIC